MPESSLGRVSRKGGSAHRSPGETGEHPSFFRRRDWLFGVVLIAAAFFAYQPVWRAGFIWDDDVYVTNNAALRSLDGLRQIWFQLGVTPQYYPLTFTSFWIDYHLWGAHPLG